MTSPPTVLVTGATGRVGRLVVDGLLARGTRVRALVRSPRTAALPREVDLVAGDLHRPGPLPDADAALLIWPGFSATGADEFITRLTGRVAHVVYLSAARLQSGQDGPTPGVWSEIEALLERAPASWTFLRSGGFAANTLQWAAQIRDGSPVRMPYPDAARSPVHERDLAEVAVRALIDPGHAGRAYAATGPQVLTQAEQVRIIGEVVGRRLHAIGQSPEEALAAMTAVFGAGVAEQSLAYWAGLVAEPERVTRDVEQVTGHPARTYAEWVRDHVHDFTPAAR